MSERLIPEHFHHCPRCGSPLKLAEGQVENKIHCAACDFTLYFNPTCSAGALIFDRTGRLLVIERARDPAKGKYGIPGGFVDFGERLEEAVVREANEEINVELRSLSFFASFPNRYHYRDVIYPVTDTYFLAQVDSFDALAAEKGEVAGIHFVDPKSVPHDKWAFDSLRHAVALYLELEIRPH